MVYPPKIFFKNTDNQRNFQVIKNKELTNQQ